MQPIWVFSDYKDYLNEFLKSESLNIRGVRSKLAKSMGCQLAYLSQVLKHKAHLSLEQALSAGSVLGHNEQESQYFITLVQLARAGSKELRLYFEKQRQENLEKRKVFKERKYSKPQLTKEEQVFYYSSWYVPAVHVMLTCPKLRTREALSSRLALPMGKISEILDFLRAVGLATQKDGQYLPKNAFLHLPQDSPLVSRHHLNWRVCAMHSIEKNNVDDLHYSSVVTISENNFFKIRELLMGAIVEAKRVIATSPEEEGFSLNLDFFKI